MYANLLVATESGKAGGTASSVEPAMQAASGNV